MAFVIILLFGLRAALNAGTARADPSRAGEVRYALGHRLVDPYLEFVAGRCRQNTLLAVAYDLKPFLAVVATDPAEVTAADVLDFSADQRAPQIQGGPRGRSPQGHVPATGPVRRA